MQLNNDFWQKYRAIVLSKGVPEAKSTWYVKWAYRFAVLFDGIPLEARTADHIKSYLIKLRHQLKAEKWQVEQASDALRILGHSDVSTTMIYTHVLNTPGLAVRSPVD